VDEKAIDLALSAQGANLQNLDIKERGIARTVLIRHSAQLRTAHFSLLHRPRRISSFLRSNYYSTR
jgi:hypothetical protein